MAASTAANASVSSNSGIKVGSRAIICQDAQLHGQITIGAGTVLHPKCTIYAYAGPIVIGDCCIVEETVVIVNRSTEPMIIGSYNLFETGCRIESSSIGSYNTFEPKSKVMTSVTIEDYCIVGAGCTLSADLLPDSTEEKESIPSHTVVFGSDNSRRTWSGEGRNQQIALMHKHLAYLSETLPKYSRLKLIT